MVAIYRERIKKDNKYLRWTHNHSHEPHIYRCFGKASRGHQIVRVYIAQLGVYKKTNGSHKHAAKAQKVEE